MTNGLNPFYGDPAHWGVSPHINPIFWRRPVSFGVGVFVLRDNHYFLTTVRKAGCKGGVGCTALPGGTVEFGERLFAAVVREVLEETGLVVTPREFPGHGGIVFHVHERIEGGEHHISLYAVADVAGGTLENREPGKHEDWRWVTPDEYQAAPTWIPDSAVDCLRSAILPRS